MKTRITAFILIITTCVAGISNIFWQQELKYQLPTPVPSGYVVINTGQAVTLPENFEQGTSHFIHFYNPDCPCSRFNARHLKSLIRKYTDSVSIFVVVHDKSDVAKAKNELGEDITIYEDPEGQIAKSCGVYSTPQAVIIDRKSRLFYRGNYNSSRYCTTRASNFAELSLIALLNRQPSPAFGLLATQSYGCELGTSNDGVEFF